MSVACLVRLYHNPYKSQEVLFAMETYARVNELHAHL